MTSELGRENQLMNITSLSQYENKAQKSQDFVTSFFRSRYESQNRNPWQTSRDRILVKSKVPDDFINEFEL